MSHAPICPQCDIQMVERTNRQTGQKFYGCKNYPKCDETAHHEDEEDDCDCDQCSAHDAF